MPFLAPRASSGLLKRKSDGEDTSPHPKKHHPSHTTSRDVEFIDVDADNTVSTSRESYHYWTVQWRLPQTKKHKSWDGDAVIAVTPGPSGSKCTLYDTEGNVLTTTKLKLTAPKPGDNFRIGEKEMEIDGPVSRADFIAGVCFGRSAPSVSTPPYKPVVAPGLARKYIPVRPGSGSIPSNRSAMPLQPINLIDPSTRKDKGGEDVMHAEQQTQDSQWVANWRKSLSSSKKYKSWEDDGYITFRSNKATLISNGGKILGTCDWKGGEPYQGQEFFLLGKEIRLDSAAPVEAIPRLSQGESVDDSSSLQDGVNKSPAAIPVKKFVPPSSFYAQPKKPQVKGPRHDPDAEGAVVMKAPSKAHEAKYNKKNLAVVPVVVDPIISRSLRPHQVDGIKFMYECVMGMRKHEGQGCILADEMGMGKTLQTIALVWTLLKQNPYSGNPVIGKCLIVCPVSLVNNWKNEFNKWIGRDRIGIFVGDKDKSVIKQFVNSKIHQVLIIGYERLKGVIGDLAYCNPPIGLIICDEGHRLKSAQSKVNQMFEALRTPRRIILSGTPIQNDLGEFHAMADFCNPGLLDDYTSFKRLYETPILKSRAPGCSSKELEVGNARSAQLLATSKSFVLRRDASILSNYLPPKFEYVVFVKPSAIQLSIFSRILQQESLDSLIRGSTARSLALINSLTKISNSPILLLPKDKEKKTGDDSVRSSESLRDAMKLLPEGAKPDDISLSGKLIALADILKGIRKDTEEKCIIVSHYTSTLDVIQAFCDKKRYTYNRLDGRTQVSKRQEFVDNFNKSSQRNCFLFLLSAKAGGVGLNLIGASRLILVDSDWNPSHDLQAMARIHRDGQKRPVFIYRLLTTGTIDEKIYQRQVTKMGLSDSLMANQTSDNAKHKSDSFSPQELRDIFTIHSHTPCHTHDLLGCVCALSDPHTVSKEEMEGNASDSDSDVEMGWVIASQVKPGKLDKAYVKKKKAELAALDEWTHVNCMLSSARDRIHDDILGGLIQVPDVARNEVVGPFASQSRGERLLATLDMESNLVVDSENAEGLDMSEIAAGTVTFVFERKAESSL